MYQFYIIDSQEMWTDNFKKFNSVDSYYSFEYGSLFANVEQGSLLAVYFEDDKVQVFYPFIKRKIPHVEDNLYDIVTPYGYGGPLINGEISIHSLIKFRDLFSSFCKFHNIVTETIRFHPLYQNHKALEILYDIKYIRKTTGVDLLKPLDEIRYEYSEMNKRNIKKAKLNNVSCCIVENNEVNIKNFMGLYRETMDRNNASKYYYFDYNYFFNQLKSTKLSETSLLFARWKNEIIAGVIVITGKEFSHYHLGASKTKFLDLRPNNLLFDFMIEKCKEKGSSILHLGGGYQENDGLFKFKTSFTNNNNYEYFLGKKIHNEEQYKNIINELSNQYELNPNYFPIYRGIINEKFVIKS